MLLAATFLVATPLSAQDDSKEEFADRFDKMYLNRDPKIGTIVEEIGGLAEDGQPFDMSRIKGKYTVFVFGCLT